MSISVCLNNAILTVNIGTNKTHNRKPYCLTKSLNLTI